MKTKFVSIATTLIMAITLIMTACSPTATQTSVASPAYGKADFTIKSLDILPSEVVTGQSATAIVLVANNGTIDGTYVITLRINGIALDTQEVTIGPGSSTSATFPIKLDTAGTYEIKVEDTLASLVVKKGTTTTIAAITPTTPTTRAIIVPTTSPASGSAAIALHQQAWQEAADNSGTNNYYKYSIYSARSLAVANPEVYLQADKLWMDMITTYGGWGLEYSYRDRVLTGTNYWDLAGGQIDDGFMRGTSTDSFQWSDFQWEQHRKNAVDIFSYYSGAPTLNWVDNRLMFLWDAMNGIGWKIPYTSLAEFEYLRLSAEGKHVYLILTDDRKGYVAEVTGDNITLENPLTGNLTDTLSSAALIVMDNEHVWYPLMGRDDTATDIELQRVVEKYSGAGLITELTEFEKTIQAQLKAGTKLNSDLEFVWAKLLAVRAAGQTTWRCPPLRELSAQIFVERYQEDSGYSDSPYEQICLGMILTEMGNRLSPVTALWADSLINNSADPQNAFLNLGSQYWQKFHRTDSDSHFVYGAHYGCWLVTLDDKLISGLGGCEDEANNCMAVLRLANIKDWEIYETNWWAVGTGGGHVICGAYTPKGDFSLSNGLFYQGDTSVVHGPLWTINGTVAYEMIYSPDKGYLTFVQTKNAANYSSYNIPFTKLTYTQTVDFLKHIQSLQGDTLIAMQEFPCTTYTISEFIDYLSQKANQWQIPIIRGLD